jgi:arylamine N-acetyltransferase
VNPPGVLKGTKEEMFGPLTHPIILVQTADQGETIFLVDVGLGGQNAARPMALIDGQVGKGAASPEVHRMVRMDCPGSAVTFGDEPSGWGLQLKIREPGDGWATLCFFTLAEYFLEDLKAMSFSVNKDGQNPQVGHVIVIKAETASGNRGMGVDDEEDLAKVSLFGPLLRRKLGDKVELLKTLSGEKDRVLTLRDVYGLSVTESDIQYLKPEASLAATPLM